jgi:gamma-D-glutamyl-L-lysine dipeptidyl-peptidase
MKNFSIILFFVLLLSFTVLPSMARTQTNETFYNDIKEELDLFEPDSSLGDKIWGLTILSVSNIRGESRHASELVTQATMGTPVKLIEEKENWLHIETPEGYNGWIDNKEIIRLTTEEIDLWKSLNRQVYNRISGSMLDTPNKKGKIVSDLILGDIFVVRDEKMGYFKISTPDGRNGYVLKKECISWNDWTSRTPNIQSIISIARQMMGSPYLWGGTSVKGVDCSGLVKVTHLSQAIVLERDASQQAMCGDSIDFNHPENLQPGDLLFFGPSPQKIIHVGIYLGKGEYIHSSGRERINSIDPLSPDYILTPKKNLVKARRIFNSLNTSGIVQVKYHPWYSFQP